jgi:histidinol-phosphate/aromatic aminotransferase/cobyric acid decarboxylase-like protein
MAGGTRRRGLGLAALVLWLGSACAEPPDEAEARLAELQAEDERMDQALDEVETRLLGNQATMHLWAELGRRHQEVSAIQCRVADEHLMGMARHYEHMEEKARQMKKARRMASVDSQVLSSGSREQLSNN